MITSMGGRQLDFGVFKPQIKMNLAKINDTPVLNSVQAPQIKLGKIEQSLRLKLSPPPNKKFTRRP